MNKLLFALILIVSGQCFAQKRGDLIIENGSAWVYHGIEPVTMPETKRGLTLNAWSDCGTPIPYEEISDWKTVDTLGDFYSGDIDFSFLAKNLYAWVEDEWRSSENIWYRLETLELNPCKMTSTTYTQYRIHKVTGIRQMRTKVKGMRYEPKPKSEYEKTVEKFTKKPKP